MEEIDMRALENCEPKRVFYYFEEICKIPHGSGNTKQISDYLVSFAKDHDFFKVKSGFIDGKVIDAVEVNNLAKLPSREVLIAQVLGGLNAPISGFATVLGGTIRGLVVALNAIAEKKQSA